jgi:hypothetical protein
MDDRRPLRPTPPIELPHIPLIRGGATARPRNVERQPGDRRDVEATRSVDQPASATAPIRVPARVSGQ